MADLEEWTRTADPEDPLRRAFLGARLALEFQRSNARGFTKRTLRKVFRERRALSKTPEPILSEYSQRLIEEFASEIHVDLPSDETQLRDMLSRVVNRTRAKWGRATESLARTLRLPRGRPASLAIGCLEILCEEILRSHLIGKRMKERVHRVVAAWAAKAAHGGFKGYLRGLQRLRQKAHSGE